MKKIKYGILGTAKISRKHISAAAKTTNSEVIAIGSRNINTANKFANELGIPRAYGSYEELLSDKKIDAIINPLPNSMHCEWTIKAAKAGKHILCEKPFSVTVKEAELMIKEAEKNNVLVMEGFTHRFKPEVRFIKELLDSGKIGRVMKVNTELLCPIEDWENDIRVKKELGGGALLDCGCYCVSLIRYILGKEPLYVQGFSSIRLPNNVDSTFMGIMKFKDNTLGYFTASQEMPFRLPLDVVTEKGFINLSNFFTGTTVSYNIDGVDYKKEFEEQDRFAIQMEHFSDCIIKEKVPIFIPQDARSNMVLIEALKRSAREGRTIKVNK